MKIATITVTAVALASLCAAASASVVNRGITEAEVLAAQAGWCKALVNINQTFEKSG